MFILYAIILGIGLGFILGGSCARRDIITTKTTDTVWSVHVVPQLRIDTLKPKTRVLYQYIDNWDTLTITKIDTLNDTTYIYRSLPYIAFLDTVTVNDTLKLKYHFPQNIFTDIYHGSKSLNVPTAVNNTTVTTGTKWTDYAIPVVAFILGVTTGAKTK